MLQGVTRGDGVTSVLQGVTRGDRGWQGIKKGYKRLERDARGYRGLKGLQGVTGVDKGIQRVTRCFKG